MDELDERLPEAFEQRHPFLFAAGDGVERILHLGGEIVIDVGREIRGEKAADDLADVGGREAPALDVDVLAIAQRRDDRGVGRRSSDAVFFEGLDQRRFGETWRRLGEMLARNHAEQFHPVADLHRGEHVIGVVLHDVVHALLIHGHVAGLDQRGTVRAQHGARRGAGRRAAGRRRVGLCARGTR